MVIFIMIFINSILMSLFPFLRMELPPEAMDLGSKITLVSYHEGRHSNLDVITKEDSRYEIIFSFLKENKTNWRYDIASYAPDVELGGNGISIYCNRNLTIIHFLSKDKTHVSLSNNSSRQSFCGLPHE